LEKQGGSKNERSANPELKTGIYSAAREVKSGVERGGRRSLGRRFTPESHILTPKEGKG